MSKCSETALQGGPATVFSNRAVNPTAILSPEQAVVNSPSNDFREKGTNNHSEEYEKKAGLASKTI